MDKCRDTGLIPSKWIAKMKKVSLSKHSYRPRWGRILRIREITKKEKEETLGDRSKFIKVFLKDLCDHCSLHGLAHIAHDGRKPYERVIWVLLTALATVGAYTFSADVWEKYKTSTTETVVETTQHGYANVAFPSVTICDVSRVDWARVLKLTPSDVPVANNDSMWKVRLLLEALSVITFGDFDEMVPLNSLNETMEDLKDINITGLLYKVMRPCSEVFLYLCWWRNKEFNCCDIFEIQKTEFGFCHAFNSDVSEQSIHFSNNYGLDSDPPYWLSPNGELRPRRTAGAGPWTGLRVTINVPKRQELPPDIVVKPGVLVMVGDPKAFPSGRSMVVTAGTFADINVWGDAKYPTPRVRKLAPSVRRCLYSFEKKSLENSRYVNKNCQQDCWQDHAVRFCNCSPDFLFISKDPTEYPPCDVDGLICLNDYNEVFNYEIPVTTQKEFYNDFGKGMNCDCLADCTSQQYLTEVTTSQNVNSTKEVQLDVHFRTHYCILYRSDTEFGWLELTVGIGGIAGLFLGGSLLSGAELIYFLTIRFFYHWQSQRHIERVPREAKRKLVFYIMKRPF
ncbi:pickpocket protein 19-like [Lycorma delicatula]|uniref:pickpocket protein 19-like n=1 Tax=Lycorma delicatula TaxID=130591 RepID=UPI003F516C21